jgi:Ca2+-binding RTX toxin-like protein
LLSVPAATARGPSVNREPQLAGPIDAARRRRAAPAQESVMSFTADPTASAIPVPDPSQFSTTIDNPFLTLRPGTTFVFEEKDGATSSTVTVTRQTVVIDGVTCIVVHDVERVNGIVVEDTFDWFAQDSEGNVWYFGEDTRTYEPGNPVPVSTEGSWKAGVDGAKPGIVMLGDPQIGDTYQQEFAPGIAEDFAKVLSLTAEAHVIYGSFEDLLKTEDVNPLDPSVEHKFYAEGVGLVLATSPDGEREQLTRIEVTGTGKGEELLGYAGGDIIRGRSGDDTIRGLSGNDTIRGGDGDDRLRGGEDHDRLNGGAGDDVLTGGSGADTFVFFGLNNGIAETETITDYRRQAIDVIDLPNGAASIASEALVGGVWQLTLKGDGDVIRLIGVSDSNGNGNVSDELLII